MIHRSSNTPPSNSLKYDDKVVLGFVRAYPSGIILFSYIKQSLLLICVVKLDFITPLGEIRSIENFPLNKLRWKISSFALEVRSIISFEVHLFLIKSIQAIPAAFGYSGYPRCSKSVEFSFNSPSKSTLFRFFQTYHEKNREKVLK